MMEHIGLAAITETPCVFINVQRAGPSTGLPTAPAQGDMMQARFGSHGDYRLIALCPNSPQESFDLTFEAFNMAEEYRVPVLVMLDEVVGHMTEKVVIPEDAKLKVTERRWTKKPPGEFKLFAPAEGSLVPEMVKAGRRVPHPRHGPHARRARLPEDDGARAREDADAALATRSSSTPTRS